MQFRLLLPVALLPLLVCQASAQSLGRTDPNGGLFPDSCLSDLRLLLDAPAGKRGFLRVSADGHFAWPDGARARFWGVNISSRSVFVDRAVIDRVVDVLARAGTNMVRFEALDSGGGLLDVPGKDSSRSLERSRLATLDYWTWRLRQAGIYYYLDLLDFRQFRPGDGVAGADQIGRAAKPYAVFDRWLIDLQKEYARQLLGHRNPHTGLRYVDDPALALVEICNEHGLFFKANTLDALIEPYSSRLRGLWNRWLADHYPTRESLAAAWGRVSDVEVLASDEDPRSGTVVMPLFTPGPVAMPAVSGPGVSVRVVNTRRAPARVGDGVRFLYDTQRAYLSEMSAALREMGVKVPITGVVSNEFVPDVASAGAAVDFTSENYYADHPAFAGKDWEGTFYYNGSNPIRNSTVYQLAPWLSALRWQNKPVVVREWATVWPNDYRCVAIPEMAAYASLQDFDAVLLFGYQLSRKPEALSDFDHQADPPVWGLYGLGALTFLRGDIAPAASTATIAWTPGALYQWPNVLRGLHRLSWFVRLNNMLSAAGQATAPAASARGASATLDRAPRRRSAPRRGRRRTVRPPLPPPPGVSIVVSPSDDLAAALDRFAAAGVPVNRRMLETGDLWSSTGQIVRRTSKGLLTVSTPRMIAICGDMPVGNPVTVGGWTIVTATPTAALMVISLDGRPLVTSRRYSIKMVSRAANTDQYLEPSAPGSPARYHLKDWGHAPVLTFGRPSQQATRILFRGKPVVSLGLADGVWELLVRDGQATLVCDTAGVSASVFGRRLTTRAYTPFTVELARAVRSAGR